MKTVAPAFADFVACVRQIDHQLGQLERPLKSLGIAPPQGQWREQLDRKLLPQMELPEIIVAAVAGGTNIGKSAVFNTLAGCEVSKVSPLASGTKHPVCLVPSNWDDKDRLGRLFESFDVRPCVSPEDPLRESPRNQLFYLRQDSLPPRLMLLDTPDIDSDAEINWERAWAILHAADVLLAVLTQQKYNDAAVRRFFKQAVAADKPLIVLFNQVDLNADRDAWPLWLEQFRKTTGAAPEAVYVIPFDREASQKAALQFHAVDPANGRGRPIPTDLRSELIQRRFDQIKLRTFRGAWRRLCDQRDGLPAYLNQLRARANEYAEALRVLEAKAALRVAWPLPSNIFRQEIFNWWDESRPGWARVVHGTYRTVFGGAIKAVKKVAGILRTRKDSALADQADNYQRREWEAISKAVADVFEQLEQIAATGNALIRPLLGRLLAGKNRDELLNRLKEAHSALPAVDDDFRQFLRGELENLCLTYPKAVKWMRAVDNLAALARPAITVTLFWTGIHVAGEFAAQVATEAAITGGVTAAGEAAVAGAGEGVRAAAARTFRHLEQRYAENRRDWLAGLLRQELLGETLDHLQRGASVPELRAVVEIERCLSFPIDAALESEAANSASTKAG